MREIEFRCRRSYDKKWIYGSLLIDNRGNFHIVENNVVEEDGHHIRIDSDSPMFFDNDTIGQFTGIYDKNGVKIYEGDILHFEYTDGQDYYKDVEEVRYNSEGCLIPFAFKYECDGCDLRYEIMSIEVIGNIHEKEKNNDE